jgi:signal transduction histidine kinase
MIEEAELQEVDLNQIVLDKVILFKEDMDKKSVKIITNTLPSINSNPLMIKLVFKNLIENAIKYNSAAEPTVKILVEEENNHFYKLCFEDNGIGIAPEHYDLAFQMFTHLNNRDDNGSGMGLAICKKITDRLNGKIWVESEVGKGSRFYVLLPKEQRA